MAKRRRRDPVLLACALITATGALVAIAGAAFYQQTSSGRLIAGLSAIFAAFASGTLWAAYRRGAYLT